jgi:hypothetical protein
MFEPAKVHRFAHKGNTARPGLIRFAGLYFQRMRSVKVELRSDEGQKVENRCSLKGSPYML